MRPPRILRRAVARVRYRVGQVTRGLHTTLGPSEVQRIRELLSPVELAMFAAMRPRDRRHSFEVLRWLEVTSGSVRPSHELAAAALLHDVGKGPLELWDRVGFVLLMALSPRLVDVLAAPRGLACRRALWRLRHHAALGAARLREGGTSLRVVALVEGHTLDGATSDPELTRLIEADRAS
ncbi:MAG: HD domain-containing protein [Dehalococcoidia bacterium]